MCCHRAQFSSWSPLDGSHPYGRAEAEHRDRHEQQRQPPPGPALPTASREGLGATVRAMVAISSVSLRTLAIAHGRSDRSRRSGLDADFSY
jgi:hypothetical protein